MRLDKSIKISVVIPTFNRAEMVVQAVESVLKQTVKPYQVIVVDDGSTDDTRTRLQPFATQIHYVYQSRQGVSAARNHGITLARGEWIAFLDSDDLWKRKKLAKQIQALNKNPEYLACYTDEEWRKNGQWLNQKKKHQKYSGWIYRYCLPLCIISPSSILMHRSLFETIGVFDDSLPACEDYDLWLRLASQKPILFLPERLIEKRAGQWEQLSEQHSLDRYRIIALVKILKTDLPADQRQETLDMLETKTRIYAQGCRKHGNEQDAEWADTLWQQYNKS